MSRRRLCSRGAAGALLLTTLAGCGNAPAGGSPSESSATLSVEQACPDTLPVLDDTEPAAAAPAWPRPTQAWVCRYDQGSGRAGGGGQADWQRRGDPHEVSEGRLDAVATSLRGLEPFDLRAAMCTADLGPRWLLAWSPGPEDAAVGVVVEDFGCRAVRLVEAGEPGPPGVLTAPDGLVPALRQAWRGAA